jgi:glucose-1-phosphate cytidylyltransferase
MNNLKCVILAGGLGTRLKESTEFKPKPMIEIGTKPILWHILKSYYFHGVSNFLISAGYRSDYIKDYFLHYNALSQDLTINFKDNQVSYDGSTEDWTITIADTGLNTLTGGRISKLKKYLKDDDFLCTYGDGVSDVDIKNLYSYHLSHGKIATMMIVRQPSRFGVVNVNENQVVESFREKPLVDGWVNAGFFVFNKKIFNYLDDSSTLEEEPLKNLASKGELVAYKHEGFWQAMDTYREQQILENLINSGKAPWIKW